MMFIRCAYVRMTTIDLTVELHHDKVCETDELCSLGSPNCLKISNSYRIYTVNRSNTIKTTPLSALLDVTTLLERVLYQLHPGYHKQCLPNSQANAGYQALEQAAHALLFDNHVHHRHHAHLHTA